MSFELRTTPGCPNSSPALELFHAALRAEGLDPGLVTVLELTSEAEAAALQFHGSPSFISDGRDLFPSAAGTGLSCRVYPTGSGLSGLPSLESLRTGVRGPGAAA
ncbi:hypothetical protein Asphe3_41030 (plasmid) [Pseudarthrobacter phenanthrenivorans Sphe3]|uniref:Alkylmercury lyase n=1 Tax=Pseudarthrobacter phenanthrenivorans (strain DSM 18606 / JCM 16027 / LMG 23796 / Sphe3) TaxID=930171 RepID=F0MCB7_PSEPM|nr:hypothetical protein [Pseudarthrobacter phenanthrenivorans]ADX75168.1 hypothetical protein Asphe3_41030 [Pseudarthrobacter phenanthrenivorans Sphe3]